MSHAGNCDLILSIRAHIGDVSNLYLLENRPSPNLTTLKLTSTSILQSPLAVDLKTSGIKRPMYEVFENSHVPTRIPTNM